MRQKAVSVELTMNEKRKVIKKFSCLAPIFWTGISIEVNRFLSKLISVGNQQILTLLTSF